MLVDGHHVVDLVMPGVTRHPVSFFAPIIKRRPPDQVRRPGPAPAGKQAKADDDGQGNEGRDQRHEVPVLARGLIFTRR